MKHWNRLLWGVEFSSPTTLRPMIIGDAWALTAHSSYDGEPTRALLFVTRRQASAWCKAKMAMYRNREDHCRDWKFRPVRVRETVKKI